MHSASINLYRPLGNSGASQLPPLVACLPTVSTRCYTLHGKNVKNCEENYVALPSIVNNFLTGKSYTYLRLHV